MPPPYPLCSPPLTWHLLCLILQSGGLPSLGIMSSPTLLSLTSKLLLPSCPFSDTFLYSPLRACDFSSSPFEKALSHIPLVDRTISSNIFFPSHFHSHFSFELFGSHSPCSGQHSLFPACPLLSSSSKHLYILTLVFTVFMSGLLSCFLHRESTVN